MADKIYKNDIGTLFRVNCLTDINDATVHRIEIMKPDETEVNWTTSIEDDQYLEYVTVDGDLDQVGFYKGHAYIETPAGKWTGERFTFEVYDKWE